jgi:hypothetical protein
MVLSEASRRSVQTILSQHKAWLAESSKFVITYGTTATTDCDLEGTTSNFESKSYRKAERALEEKLRALVADIELVTAPLLGPESKVYGLMQALLGAAATTAAPAPTAPIASPTIAPAGASAGASAAAAVGAAGTTIPTPGVLKEANASLQLLLDPTLQSLPWEATQIAGLFNGRVCRDFSLHMLGHRLQALIPTTAAAAPAVAAPVVTVTASALKYIVDPMQEDTFVGARMPGLERDSLTEAVQSLISGSTVPGTWQLLRTWGLVGSAIGAWV